ncbi:sugar kinase [Deinococcus roseus]|uniref:Fructokinase-like protein n=1 Tax=Deinococcus roseus TaxID=392414 RepID=A0ABQ2DL38_9DEIO|nr:sugar kinase [Deinococcus roseus]GGJ58512.1 fructokinase-like protein [Deinococcus roseus]
MKTLDLIGIGECMVEFHADRPLGETSTLHRSYGGDVLNTLVMGSRLGLKTSFISRVGNDPFGTGLLQAWQKEGVDTQHVPLVDGENGMYFISLLPGGEREFTYRRAGSAASQLRCEHLDAEHLASARMLLVSGITQAISESAQQTVLEAVKQAKAAGVQVVYDPNFRPRLWAIRGGQQRGKEAFFEVLPFVDVLLPSAPADLVMLELDHLPIQEALLVLSKLHPCVVLKSGEDGAYFAQQGHPGHVAADQAQQVLDTTGAGDCWNGAFLQQVLLGVSLPEAIWFAHQVAARKLAYRGAIPPKDFMSNIAPRKI